MAIDPLVFYNCVVTDVDDINTALTALLLMLVTLLQDLHSSCLLIDNLPPDYTDSLALRDLFSQLVRPIYCQVGKTSGNRGLICDKQ